MGFQLPDLIVESVIRDGLEVLRRNPSWVDNIFENLTKNYALNKYGQAELQKIKDLIQKQEISVIHSFHLAESKSPCYSIQLTTDVEDQRLAHLDDFEEDEQIDITDEDDLAALIKVSSVTVSSYDSVSGEIKVPDAVDLSQVHVNLLFVDAAGTEHVIIGGINNTNGEKGFFIAPESEVDTSAPGQIKSSLDYEQYEVRGVIGNTSLLLGVHSKDALTTKYLYILLKWILLSRKADLERRCFTVSTYQGSDFTRNLQYPGDIVFDRFLTLTGKVEDSWRSDQVELVDHIQVTTQVDQDEADTEDLELEDASIQVIGDDS